jgi:hypothetical protein
LCRRTPPEIEERIVNSPFPISVWKILVGLPLLATAAQDPDFSGSWVLDPERSYSNPAGLEQTMTIALTGDSIKLDGVLTTTRGKQVVQESWTLDGQEREVTEDSAAGTNVKRTAYRLPGRRAVVLVDDRITNTPSGPAIQKTTRKLTLSADGSTLTIDYYFDNQRGSYEARRVFVKP